MAAVVLLTLLGTACTAAPAPPQPVPAPTIEPAPAATAAPGPPFPKASDLPLNGVFEPGRLDDLLPIGTTAIELRGDGTEPRRVIQPSLPKSARLTLRVERKYGYQVVPNLLFDFTVESGVGGLSFEATTVRLAADQPGHVPSGLPERIASLAGLTVRSTFDPNGGSQESLSLPAGFDEELRPLANMAADAISQQLIPFPRAPLGVGAFWQVADRTAFWGTALLRTRTVELVRLYPIGLLITTSFFAEGPQSPARNGTMVRSIPEGFRLKRLAGSGTCLLELGPSGALPVSESCSIVIEPEFVVEGSERGRPWHTKVETSITIVDE